MRRLLVRLFIFVVLLSLPMILTIDMFLAWPFDFPEVFERFAKGGCALVAEDLAGTAPSQRQDKIERYQAILGFPIKIHQHTPIPKDATIRLAAGRQVAHFYNEIGEDLFAVPMEKGEGWISFGPVIPAQHVGIVKRLCVYGTMTLVYVLIIWVLLWPIIKQHRALEQAALKIADSDWSSRIGEKKVPDMKPLARAFNLMAGKTERIIASQRMLLRSVSHELRTPLARLRFGIELFAQQNDPDERRDHIDNLNVDLEEMDTLIDELLSYARFEDQDGPQSEATLVLPDVLSSISTTELGVRPTEITVVQTDRLREMTRVVTLDEADFQRAQANLIRNALRYARSKVLLDAWFTGDVLHIAVDDDGTGIPDSLREKIFEPFVKLPLTGSKHGPKGTGLGLAIVKQAVERNRGQVQVSPSSLGGSRFETEWPIKGS